MSISSYALRKNLAKQLRGGGVPELQAGAIADRFVDNLKSERPGWFKKPSLELRSFAIRKLSDYPASDPVHVYARKLIDNYDNALSAHFADPSNPFQRGEVVGYFWALYDFAEANWGTEGTDFKRIEKRAPLVRP